MKKSNILALAVVSLVALSGCQTNEPKKEMASSGMEMKSVQVTKVEATKSGAEQAIAAAEKARKKAGSVSGEWRDTAKFIKEAKAALKNGNFKKAVKLANKAEHQGHSGYEQAVSQKKLRMPAYLQNN